MRSLCLMCLGIVLLAGCTSVRPVQHTIEKTDSLIVREKLVPVTIPHSEVKTTLSKSQLDSLTLALRSMPANNRTIYYTDPLIKTRLSFAIDSLGKLIVRCETIEQMWMAKLQERDRYIHVKELEIQQLQKTFGQKLSGYFNTILWTVVIAMVLIAIINLLLWKLKR